MGATAIEFRLRMLINAAIITLGFWAPWIEPMGMGKRITLIEWLALSLARHGLLPFNIATPAVIIAGAVVAALAVLLRVTGAAWLGPGTVIHPEMQARAVVAAGPYRFVRNPLYLGLWCMVAAIALVMPPTGALVAMALLTIFLLRLTLGEERFLSARLGEPYRHYLLAVPRFLPRLRSPLPVAETKPHWLRAILSELTPIGVFVAIAFLSWSYDHTLMIKAMLISFGASLVVRALMPRGSEETLPAGAS